MRHKSESRHWASRVMIPLTLGVVPGGLLTFILVDAFQPVLVYLYFNRFMIPGKDVSMAGFVCIFIVLLKNLHMLVNFIAKSLNACITSKCLENYQEHYDSLKYFGSHRILSPNIRKGYSTRRKLLGNGSIFFCIRVNFLETLSQNRFYLLSTWNVCYRQFSCTKETALASANGLTLMLNIGVGVALSTCNFIITGCILEFQMDEINPGFMKSGKFTSHLKRN